VSAIVSTNWSKEHPGIGEQGRGVATPLDAILFCYVTKEYAEKDTPMFLPAVRESKAPLALTLSPRRGDRSFTGKWNLSNNKKGRESRPFYYFIFYFSSCAVSCGSSRFITNR